MSLWGVQNYQFLKLPVVQFTRCPHRCRLASALNSTSTRTKLLPMASSRQLRTSRQEAGGCEEAALKVCARSSSSGAGYKRRGVPVALPVRRLCQTRVHTAQKFRKKRRACLASPMWSQMRRSCLCSWPKRGTLMPSRYLS